jgi:hypothetical protein
VVLNWDGPRRCMHPLSPQGPSRISVGCYPWFRLHVADTFWISATIALCTSIVTDSGGFGDQHLLSNVYVVSKAIFFI